MPETSREHGARTAHRGGERYHAISPANAAAMRQRITPVGAAMAAIPLAIAAMAAPQGETEFIEARC
jgi:hypothetical protein